MDRTDMEAELLAAYEKAQQSGDKADVYAYRELQEKYLPLLTPPPPPAGENDAQVIAGDVGAGIGVPGIGG